jgi:hypothetical protein
LLQPGFFIRFAHSARGKLLASEAHGRVLCYAQAKQDCYTGILAGHNTVQQAQAEEITANLRPNPAVTVDWEYLPFFTPASFTADYLHDSTEADFGLSYLFERGHKRQRRLQAAKDIIAGQPPCSTSSTRNVPTGRCNSRIVNPSVPTCWRWNKYGRLSAPEHYPKSGTADPVI